MIASGLWLATGALNALGAHIAVLDKSGAIVFVNEAWSRFARNNGGTTAAKFFVGTNYFAVCQDAVRCGDATASLALSGLQEVLRGDRGEFSLDYPCSAPDWERWFRMSVTRFATESEPYLVVAHDEITLQKTSERALQATERLLRSVLEALPIGVWILDAEGRIVHGNPAGVAVWAGARYVGPQNFGEYKGWWVSTGERIAPQEWAAARAIRNGETSIDEEIEIECFDGAHKIILNSAVPLHGSDGRITGPYRGAHTYRGCVGADDHNEGHLVVGCEYAGEEPSGAELRVGLGGVLPKGRPVELVGPPELNRLRCTLRTDRLC